MILNAAKKIPLGLFVLLLLQSCLDRNIQSSKADQSVVSELVETKPQYVPGHLPYQSAQDKVFDLIHTKLEVAFDWEKEHVLGNATIEVSPHCFDQQNIILDAKGFDIHEVNLISDSATRALTYTYDSLKLNIDLAQTFTQDDNIWLNIKYTAKPSELAGIGSDAISNDIGLYFINSDGSQPYKPRQIWTQGETEASSCWFPTIDSPNQKTTQEMLITVDTTFVTLSNGEFMYSMENGDGTRTDYWKQTKPHAPYLFMLAVSDFDVVEDHYEELPLFYYMEKGYGQYANNVFGNTPEMIKFFSDKLDYKFPWDKYAQVVVRDYVSGAMENTSASVFLEYLNQTPREKVDRDWDYIIAHELFHQWFGDLVTCESWGQLALNESFANYSEYLWEEEQNGRFAADAYAYNETQDYLKQANRERFPIVRYHYQHREDMFDRHSYNKGGRVLHMLRDMLGDKAFYDGLNYYLRLHEYTDVEIDELRLSFEEVTGLDLHWFFEQWFLSAGHPELRVSSIVSDSNLRLVIEQTQDTLYAPVYRLPIEVAIWEDGDRRVEKFELNKTKDVFDLRVKDLELYVVDPRQILLAEFESTKRTEEYVAQFHKEKTFKSQRDALQAIGEEWLVSKFSTLEEDSLSLGTALLSGITHKSEVIRGLSLSYISKGDSDALINDEELLKLAQSDDNSTVRAIALNMLIDRDSTFAYKDAYEMILETDSSFKVMARALDYLIDKDSSKTLSYFDTFKEERNIAVQLVLANALIDQKDSTHLNWFLDNLDYQSMGAKIQFADQVGAYTKVFSDSTVQRNILDKLASLCSQSFLYDKIAGYRGLSNSVNSSYNESLREAIRDNEENPKAKEYYDYYEEKYFPNN